MEHSVKSVQKRSKSNYTESDLLYAYSPNVARTNDAVPPTFYHMFSKLEVTIKKGAGVPELISYQDAVKLDGVTLNGKFTPGTPVDMSVQSDIFAIRDTLDYKHAVSR